MNLALTILALLSLLLTLWQWLAARRFPLHERSAAKQDHPPAVTLLKPLNGCDAETEKCLRSWLGQDYAGATQMLFGVGSEADPVGPVIRRLLAEFPRLDAQLVVCSERSGANVKLSKLTQLERLAKHELILISDADVCAPPDLLANLVRPLADTQVGLVNCFYQLANPVTRALRWEAVAVNADFWSMVLQARTLAPLDFALGAVIALRRKSLTEIGGFAVIADYLADDYQLGQRIVRCGQRIELCPVVVECWSPPLTWREVWRHQLRWARTIRVSRPASYFFSVLSNATLWPLLWLLWRADSLAAGFFLFALIVRVMTALHLQWKLTRSAAGDAAWWLVPVKDLLQVALWLRAFTGSHIEWRGDHFRMRRDGKLEKI